MSDQTPSWRSRLRRRVARLLWELAAPESERWPADAVCELVDGRVRGAPIQGWLDWCEQDRGLGDTEAASPRRELDSLFPDAIRRRQGIYFTPPELADRVAGWVPEGLRSVLDPAAGQGDLLIAVHAHHPDIAFHLVEQDVDLALGAFARLAARGADVVAEVGDGLARERGPAEVDAIVMNPPYLGEKGHKALFDALRDEHAHLSDAFTPRQDLANLFIYDGLLRLGERGRLVALTTEYWLQSDAARPLRRRIASEHGLVALERFGAGRFADAPGHHSLITVVDAAPTEEFVALDDGDSSTHPIAIVAGDRWNPFAAPVERSGPALGTISKTSQGFVSGADRVTARHLRLAPGCGELGDPIFVFDEPPPPHLEPFTEPILRGNQIRPGAVIESYDPQAWVLWLDGPVDPVEASAALDHLAPFRPLLERRREARTGAMPWYRLHWPRSRAMMARPKLVTPRRAPAPTFALDLTGSPVSSDCTFIVAPDEVEDEASWLGELLVELQAPEVDAWLRRHGKTKGELIEFYAGPLESLPISEHFATQ